MPYDSLPHDGNAEVNRKIRAAQFKVVQVLPRQMYFGARRATSIDLCVRDLVGASRFCSSTLVVADLVSDPFPGFRLELLPQARRAATFARAQHVARLARRERPDVIVVQQHLPTAAAIARRLPGVPVVLHSHNFHKAIAADSVRAWLRRAVRKRRLLQLSGLIHVSAACTRAFRQAWPDVAVPQQVVHNGFDFAAWQPAAVRAPEILCVARCVPEKGVLEAARAVADVLPAFRGWRGRFILSEVATRPHYFEQVKSVLAAVPDQVAIEVQQPWEAVKAAYERAAIALVPSKWTEPFGRTALEAHAGGAALISSGTGGLAEISGDSAVMLPEVTSRAIAAALLELMTDHGLRERLAYEGAERVRMCFNIRTQAERMDAFLLSLAAGRAMPAGLREEPETPTLGFFKTLDFSQERSGRGF